MKLLENNKPYIEFAELVAAIAQNEQRDPKKVDSFLRNANSTGNKGLPFVKDPDHGAKVIYCWEGMKDKYRRMVEKTYGPPMEFLAKEPIRKKFVKDFNAEEFYFNYELVPGDNTKKIPADTQAKYTNEASWLNLIIHARDNAKKVIKDELKLNVDQFLGHVRDLMQVEKEQGRISANFPLSYIKLLDQVKDYRANGYACLIAKQFGNKSAAKIIDEVSEDVLLEMLCHPNQFNDVTICNAYNEWAKANGYKTIDDATVGNHRRKNMYRIMPARNGNAAWYDTYGKIIHRKRPSAPLLLVGSDDNDLDLYFIHKYVDSKGKKVTDYYYRYKLIVVMDAYNDYILGYAYGDEVTKDLIKAAYLDAVYHIKELTGGWYLPRQIQTDRWAVDKKLSGDLATFYQSLARYTPATLKVARAKFIEQAFGNTWHENLKRYPNYAGQNITSQVRVNPDALQLNKSSFPLKDEAHRYIADHIERMRNLKNDKGATRQQAWIDMFSQSELSSERQIGDARMLQLFGTPHNYTNTITNGGLTITLDNEEHIYDIPDNVYLQLVGKKVQVTYDIYNKERVLVTDGDKLRFVAHSITKTSSALKDFAIGERAHLNYLLEQKRAHVASITNDGKRRKDNLQRIGMNANSILQAGIQTKAIQQKAVAQIMQATTHQKAIAKQQDETDWEAEQEAYLNSKLTGIYNQ